MTNPPAQTPAAALAPVADPLERAGAADSAAADSMAEIGESERDPVGDGEAAMLGTGEGPKEEEEVAADGKKEA